MSTRPRSERAWYIEVAGTRTPYANWTEANEAWKSVTQGYLCRNDGTLLDYR